METFEQAAVELEDFLWGKRPLEAKPRQEIQANDTDMITRIQNEAYQMFDGVLYVPQTREVYCTYYDHEQKGIVFVPAIDLVFKDRTIQQRVNRFRRHYDAR
jgi:hypothetical protein